MYDADAIEAINFEQLATITDRLLLRHGRRPSRLPPAREPASDDRFSVPSLIAHPHPRPVRITSTLPGYLVSGPPRRFARGSQPRVAGETPALIVRPDPAAPRARARWIAVTVVIPALLGAVAGLLMLL